VNAQLRGDEAVAAAAYAASLAARPTPWALRGLATLATDVDEADRLYTRARTLAPHVRGLATEHLTRLLEAGRPDDALRMLDDLPAAVRRHGRTRLLEAQALLAAGRPADADAALAGLVVEDLAEGDAVLGDLWRALHPDEPLPAQLDFQMTDA
jgi:hypothetical protein